MNPRYYLALTAALLVPGQAAADTTDTAIDEFSLDQLMDGDIEVESTPGIGSTFSFYFTAKIDNSKKPATTI